MAELSNTIGTGSTAGALQYLEFLSAKGHVTPGAIRALKTGFSKVIKTVGGEDWENIEVRSIDIDRYMGRFANMTNGQYNPNSLTDYRSRVRKVVTWYLEFLSKPGWTPDVKTRTRSLPKSSAQEQKTEASSPHVAPVVDRANRIPDVPDNTVKSNLIAFPFPLADGTLATLYLPPSIGANDAGRMSRFIATLVIDGGENNDRS